ncbi:hypothetical protein NEOLI_005283, partial [Neolecta irregularis DAH-3]
SLLYPLSLLYPFSLLYPLSLVVYPDYPLSLVLSLPREEKMAISTGAKYFSASAFSTLPAATPLQFLGRAAGTNRQPREGDSSGPVRSCSEIPPPNTMTHFHFRSLFLLLALAYAETSYIVTLGKNSCLSDLKNAENYVTSQGGKIINEYTTLICFNSDSVNAALVQQTLSDLESKYPGISVEKNQQLRIPRQANEGCNILKRECNILKRGCNILKRGCHPQL